MRILIEVLVFMILVLGLLKLAQYLFPQYFKEEKTEKKEEPEPEEKK